MIIEFSSLKYESLFMERGVADTHKPLVTTYCGPVIGSYSTAFVFKEIPYAVSPSQDLRWT